MINKIDKVYIAGALTHEDEKVRQAYEKVAQLFESLGVETYVPHLSGVDPARNPEVLPYDVWKKNIYKVAPSNLLVAYVGKPSLGTGAELEIARITETDIILWWFTGEKVSRMARGNPAVVEQIEAEDENDLLNKLKTVILSKYEK